MTSREGQGIVKGCPLSLGGQGQNVKMRRSSPPEALREARLRRRAHRVEPAADVDLGVSFAAIMPGSGRVGGFRTPPVHGKLGISTPNHEPVDRITGHASADFTSEFPQGCHAFSSVPQWRIAVTSRSEIVADLASESSIHRLVPSSRHHKGGRHDPSSKALE